ncbi:MAG: CAP domain-containing protein [Gaiellales bacterium]
MPRTGRRPSHLAVVTALLVLALATAAPVGATAPATTSRAAGSAAVAADVVSEINATRRARGLRPLRLATGLVRAARAHAQAMAAGGFFSHSSRDGTSPATRIRRFYDGSVVGETLLWRSPTVSAEQALEMWLDSSSHRKILMSRSFRDVGIGIVHADSAPGAYGGRQVTIVVADFGSR